MIFDSFVLSLEPNRYIPFDDRENGIPKEIFFNAEVNVPSDPQYKKMNTFLGEAIFLPAEETVEFDTGIDSNNWTLAFWIQVDTEESYQPLYFFDNDGRGTIINIDGDTLVHSFGDGSSTQSFSYGTAVDEGPNLIAISFDGTTYRLIVNNSQLTESSSYSTPQIFARFFSGSDTGEKSLNQIFVADYAIENETLWKGYSVGTTGKEIKKVLSGSEIELSQGNIDSLQTSWQAYGVVVSKR
jgi:hypothetical protein